MYCYLKFTLLEYLDIEILVIFLFRGNDLILFFIGVIGFVVVFFFIFCVLLFLFVFDVLFNFGWVIDESFRVLVVVVVWFVVIEEEVVRLVEEEGKVELFFVVEKEFDVVWVVDDKIIGVCLVEGEVEVKLIFVVGEEFNVIVFFFLVIGKFEDVEVFGVIDDNIGVFMVLCLLDDDIVVMVVIVGLVGLLSIFRFRKFLLYLLIVMLKN